MADDLNIREPQDKFKINIHEEWELNWWSQRCGVSKQKKKDVAKHLGKTWP
jgi:anaerobic selenocysteine-containing dehydrogenase